MTNAFTSIKQGLEEATEFSKAEIGKAVVHEFASLDVKNVRANVGLPQSAFAAAFGINVSTLMHWERGDQRPRGRAWCYLMLSRSVRRRRLRL